MHLVSRKTIYLKVVKSCYTNLWPRFRVSTEKGFVIIQKHFIILSDNERVYRFIPRNTCRFHIEYCNTLDLFKITPVEDFRLALVKALFRDKNNLKIPFYCA